jgi:DNA-binding transcriptional LysR family regulator
MDIATLRKADLNLVVVFESLMVTSSATRTAKALHTTQPAISRSLARLRHMFGDPLLVNVRGKLEPTPRAQALRPVLRDVLITLDSVLGERLDNNPQAPVRPFNVMTISPIELWLAPRLQGVLERERSGVTPRFVTPPSGIEIPEDELDQGIADLAIARSARVPARFCSQDVMTSERVCLVRDGHPLRSRRLSVDQVAELRYVATSNMADRENEVDVVLRELNLRRRITLRVSNIAIAPYVLLSSDLAMIVPKFAARILVPRFSLRVLRLPFASKPNVYSMIWHRRWDTSPFHAWIRGVIKLQLLE